MIKKCRCCNNNFETIDKRQKFCDRKCFADSKKLPATELICHQCQKTFVLKKNRGIKRSQKFCSQKCYGEYRRGKYSGKNHNSWKGGVVYWNGYRYLYVPEHPHATNHGYIAEHRLVVEKNIGRIIDPIKEVVHHVDKNKLNNDIANLKLMNRAEHLLLHHFPDKYESLGH